MTTNGDAVAGQRLRQFLADLVGAGTRSFVPTTWGDPPRLAAAGSHGWICEVSASHSRRGRCLIQARSTWVRRVVGVGGTRVGRRRASRTSQGVWWMARWCSPQSRTRLASEVGPPSAQWMMWWAWHIDGWSGAAGERAVLVAQDQGDPDRHRDQAGGRPTSRTIARRSRGHRG